MTLNIIGYNTGYPLLAMLGLILILVATWIFLKTRQRKRVKRAPKSQNQDLEMDVLGMEKKAPTNTDGYDRLNKAINLRAVLLIILLIVGLLLIYYGSTGYKEVSPTPTDTELNISDD